MSNALRKPTTLDDLLARERRQEFGYEFDGVQPVAMRGGTYAHDAVVIDLATALGARLRGTPCRRHGGNPTVLAEGRARSPDAFVSCRAYGNADTFARDPVVISEVLSPGAAGTERIGGLREYTALRMSGIGVEPPLAELYDGVGLASAPGDDAA